MQMVIDEAQQLFKQTNDRPATGQLNRVVRADSAGEDSEHAQRPEGPDLLRHANRRQPADDRAVRQQSGVFDETYQRFMINRFRELLPYQGGADPPDGPGSGCAAMSGRVPPVDQTDPDAPATLEGASATPPRTAG